MRLARHAFVSSIALSMSALACSSVHRSEPSGSSASEAAAQPPSESSGRSGQPPTSAACAWSLAPAKATATLETRAPDGRVVALTETSSEDAASGSTTQGLAITLGGKPGIDMESTTTRAGAIQTTLHYGAAFHGIEVATFESQDGLNFVGILDGRKTAPFTAKTASALRFVDGKPAPTVTIDPVAQAAIESALEQAKQGCSADGSRAPLYEPGSGTQARCADCTGNCAKDSVICDGFVAASVVAACAFSFGIGCGPAVAAGAVALVGCDTALLTCVGVCEATTCCPKLCGVPDPTSPGSGCCDSGESCVSQDDPNARNGCCPSGHGVCGGNCCALGENCCGSSCCGAGSACMQDTCCPAGTPNVCNGKCCNGSCDQSGNCCDAQYDVLCGGVCHGTFTGACVDGQWCASSTDVVIGGSCCSALNACGNTCCGSGQACQGGSCVAVACGQGQDGCVQPNGQTMCCNQYQCDNPQNGDVCTESCCNGVCCGPGNKCCGGVCAAPNSPACVPR